MKRFLTLISIILFCATNAQENFHEESYSAELKNIPQNSIKSIVPDKYGFIWMTTENGLLRFDGKSFQIYNSGNFNLLSNRFTFIGGNIQRDSLRTYTSFYVDDILINKRTVVKKRKSNNFKTFNNIPTYEEILYFNDSHNDARIDFRNSKIICDNGYYYLIGEKTIVFFNEENKKIKELKYDYKENTIYFLYKNELILLDYKLNNYLLFTDNFQSTFNLTIPKNSKIIYNHTVQQLFVCTKNKILLLDKIKNLIYFTSVFSKPNIGINIKSLYYDDKNEKLFVGSLDSGLKIISKNIFNTIINPLNTDNNYYASFPISENEFVTSKGEIFDGNRIVKDLKIKKLHKNYSIAVDRQKNIWFSIENEIIKYLKSTNYKTNKTYTFNYKVAPVFCDSKNQIWVGLAVDANKNAKVYTIDANNEDSKPIVVKSIDKPVDFFVENQKREILMVCEKEILIYNVNARKIKSVPSGVNEIRSLFIAKDQTVWACTYNNGFSLLENDSLYKMPSDNKMYLLSAHCIKEDKMGYFWISTNKGLIQVKKESLLKYRRYKTPVYYNHFNIESGFLTNEFNGGCQPCGIELKDQFIFPSLNGMVMFNPSKVQKEVSANNFYITEADLDGKTVFFKDKIIIDRAVNRIKFKIDNAYFGNQDNICFNVKLNLSENAKWVNLENDKEIIYTNLPRGTHTLYVRRIKPFTSEFETKKITVCVPALFYETLYFKFCVFILLLGILILIVQGRFKHIRKKNDDLEKVVNERTAELFDTVVILENTKRNLKQEILQQKKLIGTISHDIRSPLRFLSITANHLYDKSLLNEDQKIKNTARVMQESAGELYRFVATLVDYSKVFMADNDENLLKKENINSIIQEKINLFRNIAHDKNIAITYTDLASNQINMNKNVFGIIIHNLLDNAIKNTTDGTIILETKVIQDKVYVSIQDTGIGMPTELRDYYINMHKNYETDKLAIQNYGLGLHMVLELLRLLKGDIEITTVEDKGTKITVIIDND